MATNLKIKRIVEWIYPLYGNVHCMPYGKLEVTDGVTTKIVSTKGDKLEDNSDYQYITFNRKRYKVVNYYENNLPKLKLELVK